MSGLQGLRTMKIGVNQIENQGVIWNKMLQIDSFGEKLDQL